MIVLISLNQSKRVYFDHLIFTNYDNGDKKTLLKQEKKITKTGKKNYFYRKKTKKFFLL